jgi:hypothetical protein
MKLKMTEGAERFKVPTGQYRAKFMGVKQDDRPHPEYGIGLKWQFEVVDGPSAGKIASRTTSSSPTLQNACGRMLQMLTGGTAALHEEFDLDKHIGRLFQILVEANSTGSGTRIGSVMPVATPPTNGTPPNGAPLTGAPANGVLPPVLAARTTPPVAAPAVATARVPSPPPPGPPPAAPPPPPPPPVESDEAMQARCAASYWVVLPTAAAGAPPVLMNGDPPVLMNGDQLSQVVAVCGDPAAADQIHVMSQDQVGGWRKPRDFGFVWGAAF